MGGLVAILAINSSRPLWRLDPQLLSGLHFAAEAKVLHVNELRVVQPGKRHVLVLCLLERMQLRTRDDVADMFVKRMMKIHNQARDRLLQIQAQQRETAEHLICTLSGMLEILGTGIGAEEKIQNMDRVVGERGGLDSLREDCEAVRAWSNSNYFPLLARPYQRYRHVLFRLAKTLQFVSTTQDQSLLTALNTSSRTRTCGPSGFPPTTSAWSLLPKSGTPSSFEFVTAGARCIGANSRFACLAR